jgi:hypothetical protein
MFNPQFFFYFIAPITCTAVQHIVTIPDITCYRAYVTGKCA